MAGMTGRFTRAWRALLDSPGVAEYAASTVRPAEATSRSQRYKQWQASELVLRFVKHIKTANSRNAQGVASTPLCVYRRGRGSMAGKSEWRTRRLDRKEIIRLQVYPGVYARKSAMMDDGIEEITDPLHPLVSILRNANLRDNGFNMLERLQMDVGLTGDHYWHPIMGPAIGGVSYPVEVYPLDAQFVRPIPDRERIVSGFIYGRGTEVERLYDATEIIQFMNPNPTGDPYHGRGDLAACIDEADLSVAFTQFAYNMIQNGAQPGMVVSPKDAQGGMTEGQALAIEARLNNRSGPNQAGRNIVFHTPMAAVPLALGDKEISFLASDDKVRDTIAECHDMPVELLTLRPGGLGSDSSVLQHWQKFGLHPRCKRIEDQLNARFCPLFTHPEEIGRGEEIFVAFKDVVTEDMAVVSVRVVGEWNAGLRKLNEARVAVGLDAVDTPDGDEFKAPDPGPFGGGNADNGGGPPVPSRTGSSGKHDSADGAGGKGLLARPPDGGQLGAVPHVCQCAKAVRAVSKSASTDDCIANAIRAVRLENPSWSHARVHAVAEDQCGYGHLNPHTGSGGGSPAVATPAAAGGGASLDYFDGKDIPTDCCARAGKDDDFKFKLIAATERQMEAALREAFGIIGGRVNTNVDGGGLGIDLASDDATLAALRQATTNPLTSLILQGWATGLSDVGERVTPDMAQALTQAPQEYLREYQNNMITSVASTLGDKIRASLADGIGAGENIGQLTARAQEVIGGARTFGAERIARTESSRAFLSAREDAWAKTGEVLGWRWALSAAPCEVCQALSDQIDSMEGGYAPLGSIDLPPGHPNCRCSTVAVFKGEGE